MKQLFICLLLLLPPFLATSQEQDASQLHNIWILESIKGEDIEEPEGVQIRLEIYVKELRFLGYSGCNNFSGKIDKINNDRMNFGPAAMTKKFCEETADLETNYLAALGEVRYWSKTSDGLLILQGEGGDELLKLEATD